MNRFRLSAIALLLALGFSGAAPLVAKPVASRPVAPQPAASKPIEIHAVVVTAFEIGADTGDTAGEFQAWASTIPTKIAFPAGDRPLRYDPARGLLILSTGIGTNRAASAVMALGTDPRFDLTHAYWLIAAIAGVNPHTASVGSAAWIGDIVDTDYGYAIDPREIPKDWETGMYPRDRARPYQGPRGEAIYNLFPVNKGLRDWAYRLTSGMTLADGPILKRLRAGYGAYPAALCPPFILRGDEATGQTFWHGTLLNEHVVKWIAYWTQRPDSFVMTGMEDSGVAFALATLGRMGRADADRLMVLRTGSNYTVQPAGKDAAQSLEAEAMELSALQPSLDAAFQLGSRVVNELTGHWPRYRASIPTASAPAPTPALAPSGGCAPAK
ncbi:MAG TPA: purine nucleoside permease [Sphingobium sp.]